ncbi:hypothetical protein G9H64_09980 [Aquirufa nivalisilvae]|uniref:hypothetical protein n=1 Tax=Aquirufa nivalisilvae TaxID=2516557 RepID=UPI0022A980C1|nr:hypothetical protein [Aquirufa nivalisilvae]MCZ2479051.1 hypothetical protein [Aquirufa nivalisilvae]MCZ2483284.1 hypothetical protein [Aquirufa nivalisilvae]
MYKLCIGLVCLFLFFPTLVSAVDFEWFNTKSKQNERINLNTRLLERKNHRGVWMKIDKLTFSNIDLRDIPNSFISLKFNFSGKHLFTIPGTGQVYLLDKKSKLFTRIDETYYRGYNFNALQFIRNDTLFSLGGHGFWLSNNILTFFDFRSKEWSAVGNENGQPLFGVTSETAGLLKHKNEIISIVSTKENTSNSTKKFELYLFNLNSRKWLKIGNIDYSVLKNLGIASNKFILLDDLIFFNDPLQGYFADFQKNKIYKYTGIKRNFFNSHSKIYIENGWVYSVTKSNSKQFESTIIDSLKLEDIKKGSNSVGKLYNSVQIENTRLIIYSIVGLTIIIVLLKPLSRYNNSSIRLNQLFTKKYPKKLPKGGNLFIRHFKENGLEHYLTTNEMSNLLNINKKAYDTQRQYRSQFICNMNEFFYEHAEINNAILRISLEDDKRFVKYGLKQEALEFVLKNNLI